MKKKVKKARRVKISANKPVSRSRAPKSVKKNKLYLNLLNKKREDIQRVVKNKEGNVTLGEIGDEADAANQTFEREMSFEMTNGERTILDDIEAALRKIEKLEFGICESCHRRITSQRLHAMPWARYCIQCQSRSERRS